MKKNTCNIIRDILPLYLDEVVSEDTREMVEEHLQTCEACRQEAKLMKADVVLPVNPDVRMSEKKELKQFRSLFRRKKVIVSLLSAAAVLAVMIGGYCWMNLKTTVIPYSSSQITVKEIDGELYVYYRGEIMKGTVGFDPQTVTIDGEKKNIAAFYFYSTLWSQYVEPFFSRIIGERGGENQSTLVQVLGRADEIDAVYYGEFEMNMNEPWKEIIRSVTEECEVIWER